MSAETHRRRAHRGWGAWYLSLAAASVLAADETPPAAQPATPATSAPSTRAIPAPAPAPTIGIARPPPVLRPTPALPDLMISASLSPPSPTPYDPAQLSLYLMNNGTADATIPAPPLGQFPLALQIWTATGTPVLGTSLPIPNLPVTVPVGGSVRVLIPGVSIYTANPGSYQWSLTLNSGVQELSTANNSVNVPVVVQPRPAPTGPTADLTISACIFQPARPVVGSPIVLGAVLLNTGAAAAQFASGVAMVRVQFSPPLAGRASLDLVSTQDFATVYPGNVYPEPLPLADASVSPAAVGTYQVTIIADPDNRVAEGNKSNNVRQCSLTVLP